MTRAWISETRSPNDEDVVRSGSEPDIPVVVDQATFQCVVTDTRNTPPGSEAEPRAYVQPQSGELRGGFTDDADGYSAPGPRHVTDPPSPIDHTENAGVAVIVNDTPPTDTVTDFETHEERVDIHTGNPTN